MSDAFQDLSPDDRRRAEALAEQFRALGAEEPEAWAASEVKENIPQLARFLFLRMLWRSAEVWDQPPEEWFADDAPELSDDDAVEDDDEIDDSAAAEFDFADEEPPFLAARLAVERILAAGVDPADLRELARAVFMHAAFDAVHTVDEGHDPDAGEGLPGWLLTEVGGDLVLTGRMVDCLHEDLLTMQPDRPDQDA